MEQSENSVKSSSKLVQSKKRKSNNEKSGKKPLKRCHNNKINGNESSIPIFTDAFLDLFRKQKSEIRSLKYLYSQLSERFKLKDAQQEQIRLDNQKMRLDIEEISQKNYFFQNQIEKISQEFKEKFHQDINEDFLENLQKHSNNQDYKYKLENIIKSLQL